MKILIQSKESQIKIIISFFILIVITSTPLFQEGIVLGDDLFYHLLRIESIKDSILAGNHFALIHETVFGGYGYGSGIFYPNFYLYFPALLGIMGLSISVAYKIFLIFIAMGTCASTYFSIKYISRSKYASWLGTILFVSSQYRLINLYDRAAMGEYIAMMFFPIVVCGIFDVLYCKCCKPWILGVGFAGILLAHPLSAFVFFLITLAIFCVHIKYFIKNYQIVIKLALLSFVVFLCTMFFLLPMFEMMSVMDLKVKYPWTYVSSNTLNLPDIFRYSTEFRDLSIGIPIVLLSAGIVLFRRSKFAVLSIADKSFILGWLLCLAVVPEPIWKLLDNTMMNAIQFPWRLFGFASIFLSISLGIYYSDIFKKGNSKKITILIITVVIAFATITVHEIYKRETYQLDFIKDKFHVNQGEWLPVGTNIEAMRTSPLYAIDEEGQTIPLDKKGNTVTLELRSKDSYVDIPLLFYKGYEATLKEDNISEVLTLEIVQSTNNNLVRVLNPLEKEGTLAVFYAGTIIQKISYCVSMMTVLGLLAIFLNRKRKSKMRQIS